MKRTASLFVLAFAFVAFATTAGAQSSGKFGIELAGIYATLSGDDFEGTDAGVGFDVQGRYAINPAFSLGAGVQRTTHGVEGFENDESVLGFFLEPRYNFTMSEGSNLAPFLSGRVAMINASLEEGGSEAKASGTLFGFGGGLQFQASPTIRLTGSVTYNIVNLGEVEIDGSEIPDSDASGSSLAVRFGVAFNFR